MLKACLALNIALVSPFASTARAPSPPATLAVWAEPADGYGQVYSFILSAKRSVDMTMYELADANAERDLAADAARGIDVRVLLDSAYHGASYNEPAYSYLRAHRVHVKWAPRSLIVHQKTITVDNHASLIMTGNLTSEYYQTSADLTVEDASPSDVATITKAFDDDWGGGLARPWYAVPVRGHIGDLVFSPGFEGALLDLISQAKRTLETSSEEMSSYAIEGGLEAAARRGVDVKVLMTEDPSWDYAFDQLKAAGVHIKLYPFAYNTLYIHAKAIIADGKTVYVGSINYSTSSMTYNRELGVITSNLSVVEPVARAWARWWAAAPITFS